MKKLNTFLDRVYKFIRADRRMHDDVENLKDSLEKTIKLDNKKVELQRKAKKSIQDKDRKSYNQFKSEYRNVKKNEYKLKKQLKTDVKRFKNKIKKMYKLLKF